MAYSGKVISNAQTGQSIKFIQTGKETNGQLLEMESNFKAHSIEPVQHYHPYQEEDFIILSGEVSVRINGEVKILKQGNPLHIPFNVPHSMWNNSDADAIVNWKVRPAFDTEYLLETGTGLANDGKVNDKGMPNILQVALMGKRFSKVYRLTKPPYVIQRILFSVLTPIAYVMGFKPMYKKYID
jgi:quercetin dioxygenase-like cupin family protein